MTPRENLIAALDGRRPEWIPYTVDQEFATADAAWPTVARLADGSLFSVYYQQAAPDEQCSIRWSKWRLPA